MLAIAADMLCVDGMWWWIEIRVSSDDHLSPDPGQVAVPRLGRGPVDCEQLAYPSREMANHEDANQHGCDGQSNRTLERKLYDNLCTL
eukprot:9481865-Pyramimonas_sp.AAC.1